MSGTKSSPSTLRRNLRIALAASTVVALLGEPRRATAQAPAAAPTAAAGPSAESAAAAAAEAKELNKQGVTLLDAGDLERALDRFVRSRKVLPTTKNTTNAAIVLDRLGRFDEALELYEELLLKYAGGLDDEDRAAIAPAMADLRGKVGSIAVSSSAGGTLFVDGRERARLPVTIPVRVLPGKHTVRVTRAGYRDFDASVEVAAGGQVQVEATLAAIQGVGVISVENLGVGASDVFVDGVKLGVTPWEGSVPPGQHLVWLARGDLGTAPTWVQVVGGQSALVRLQPRPLGPPLTIRVEPKTATFDVDGVRLGPERWEGRLPSGTHELSVAEAGYFAQARRLELVAGGPAVDATVKLEIDPAHPRWPRPRGEFLVEIYGGPLVGSTLAGDPDAGCPERCESSSAATGFQIGARGGYRFPIGVAVELGGGWLSLGQSVRRTETDTFGDEGTTVTYRLDDETEVHGPFFTASASFRRELGRFFVGARGTVGLLVATSADPLSGTAATTGDAVPVRVENADASAVSAAPFLAPEALGGVRLGPVDLGLTLGVAFFPALGPRIDRGRFGPTTRDGVADPTAVENAQESDVVDDERTYGRFLVVTPALTAQTSF